MSTKSSETPKAVGGCWSRWRGIIAESHRMHGTPIVRRTPMFRYALIGLAVVILAGASLVPDDAFARRGGGGGFRGGGGFHGGGLRGWHAWRLRPGRGCAWRAIRPRVSPDRRSPGSARGGCPGVYRGAAYRGAYRGAAYGAAAVGAAGQGPTATTTTTTATTTAATATPTDLWSAQISIHIDAAATDGGPTGSHRRPLSDLTHLGRAGQTASRSVAASSCAGANALTAKTARSPTPDQK